MRYLLFSLLFCLGCASDYKSLNRVAIDRECLQSAKRASLSTSWFNASVDVVGKHISGLLLIKKMPDSSSRIVFTTETGKTLFDFEFTGEKELKVHYVIPQLDRKPVISILHQDFALILQEPFEGDPEEAFINDQGATFFAYRHGKKTAFFITKNDCSSLEKLEWGSRRKRVTSALFHGNELHNPDSISVVHHTFNMNITLRKLMMNNVIE